MVLQEGATVKEMEWLDVSPGKPRHSENLSQRRQEFGQVSLLTKSRFVVLTSEDDHETTGMDNEEKEEEDSLEMPQEEEVITRKMLPRECKINHRYLKDKAGQKTHDADPGNLKKKKNRRQ